MYVMKESCLSGDALHLVKNLQTPLVNILATDPVSFPTPTVEGTCFLPQFFARACGLGEELISICTKIGA